jgi:3-dehydroquinate synthetase
VWPSGDPDVENPPRHVIGKRVLVVTNTTVAPLYLEKVTWALTHNNPNVSVESVVLPDGEKYKDMVITQQRYTCVSFRFIHHLDVVSY